MLASRVLHADETPVALLDPGAGKTRKAYVWAYARSHHDPTPGVVYEFARGRGAQYPRDFLAGDEIAGLPAWQGTLLTDRYGAYDPVLDERVHPGRKAAACVAHARRKFDELAKAGTSAVGEDAIQRFASIYAVERELAGLSDEERRSGRQALARPLWDQLGAWLHLERRRVADGGSTAAAIDYTLKHWTALTHHLEDGAVPIDSNHLERQIKPWAMGRNKANSGLMRIRYGAAASATRAGPAQGTDTASHNHNPRRNANRAFGAWYRACLTSGCFRRANARSFMARSASTYM